MTPRDRKVLGRFARLLRDSAQMGLTDASIKHAELCGIEVHEALRMAKQRGLDDDQVGKLMSQCPDPECARCAAIVCRDNDPMHFHHDGCPSCSAAQ